MDNKLSIGDAGSLLLGAGLTKLDQVYLALTLILVGVALKILVAYLKKEGLDVSKKVEPLG
jgi:hypothetical protein